MVQGAKLASAKRITVVIPWYPYSRQDKKSSPREPITARLVADLLQVAGADRVLTMDLHAGQVQGFFDIPVDHMTALPQFAQYFRDKGLTREELVVVSPTPAGPSWPRSSPRCSGRPGAAHQGAPVAQRGRGHEHHRRRERQGRDHQRRHHRHRRHARARAPRRSRRAARRGSSPAPPTPSSRARPLRRIEESVIEQVVVCDTIPVDPVEAPGQGQGAVGGPDPGRHDRQRLPRRLGLGDLRGREPALRMV